MNPPATKPLASKRHALTAALLLCAPFAQAQQPPAPTEAATSVPDGRIPRSQDGISIDAKLHDAA